MKRLIAAMAAPTAVAALFAEGITAPTAHADSDSDYLGMLDAVGVRYSTAASAIAAGHTTCRELRGGMSYNSTLLSIIANDYSPSQAGEVIGAAVLAYCPEMQPTVESQIGD